MVHETKKSVVSFSKNLKSARLKSGKTQKDVALELGMSKNGYASYEQGNSSPDAEKILKLADSYDVTVSMLFGEPEAEYTATKKSNVQIIDRQAQAGVSIEEHNPIRITATSYFPFLPPGQYYGLAAVGDSMVPNIMPGEYVICQEISREQFVNDSVYVAVTRSGVNIKRLRLIESISDPNQGKIALMSDNDRVSTWFLEPDEIIKLFKVTDVVTRRKL